MPSDRTQAGSRTDSVTFTVAGCDQGEGIVTTLTRTGAGDALTRTVPGETGDCSAAFPLVSEDGAAAEVATYRFTAVTTDALGNQSAATERTVIYDSLAPPTPSAVQLVPAPSRIDATWTYAAPPVGDDGAVASVVSYSVLPREEDTDAACPFGHPTPDDAFDVAAFAAEGRSPLQTTEQRLSLTEIPTGTTVYLQVAGTDALGNQGCYSAPVAARVDAVTLLSDGPQEVSAFVSSAEAAGTVARAMGNAGLALTFADGSRTVIDVPAFDVVAGTRKFFAPAREAGLLEVEVDDSGAVIAQTLHSLGTVRSVAKRPGVLLLGTASGMVATSDEDPVGDVSGLIDPGNLAAPVEKILNFGRGVLLLRDASPPRLQLVRRDDPSVFLGTLLLPQLPHDVIVAGNAVLIATRGGNVQRTSLGACRLPLTFGAPSVDTNVLGCLSPQIPVPLPAPAEAKRLRVVDDLLAVAAEASGETEATGIYLANIAGAAVDWVGQAPLPQGSQVRALERGPLGICATITEDNTDREHCFSLFFLARIVRDDLLASGVSVGDIIADDGEAYLTEASSDLISFDVGVVRGAVGSPLSTRYVFASADAVLPGASLQEQFPLGAPRAHTVTNLKTAAVSIDQYGRLHAASSSDLGDAVPLALLDAAFTDALLAGAPALVESTANGDHLTITSAFAAKDGEAIVFALSNARAAADANCADVTLARVALAEDLLTGELEIKSADVLTLGQARAVGRVVVEGGEARVSTAPFGLLRARLSESLATLPSVEPDCSDGLAEQSAAFDILRHDVSSTWVSARRVENGVLQHGVYAVDADQAVSRLDVRTPGEARVGTAIGNTLFIATENDGAFVLDTSGPEPWFPILALPTVRDSRIVRATARGFVVANGAFGANWFVLQ